MQTARRSTEVHQLTAYGPSDPLAGSQAATLEAARPPTVSNTQPTPWDRLYRQLLGINPFKNTYLDLYDPLESVAEKAIACSGAIFAVAAGVPLPVIGYLFGRIINEFPPQEDVLRQRLIQLVGVAIAYFGSTAIYTIAFGLTAENVSVKLRIKLLDCLLHLDQAYLDTHDIDVHGLLTEKMDTIQAGCSEKVGIFIQAMSYFVASFIVGFILDAKLAGILLVSVVPAITLSFALLSPAISRCSQEASQQTERATALVESAFGAVRVVQAFDMIEEVCRRHLEFLHQSTHSSVRKAIYAALQSGLIYFIAYAANALAFYLGSRIASSGNAGTVYAVVFLILDASFVVGQFAPFLEIFARAASAKSVIKDIFDAREKTQSPVTYRSTDKRPDLRSQDIAFSDVKFQYPARPTISTLNGLDLKLEAGSFTAIVGTSGGGKSTLVALLLGIYDYAGCITIGQDELRTIDSRYLRSQIAVLDQDTALLSGTIYENVCHGLISQSMSEQKREELCCQALKDANVDFLDQLPNGLHTKIGNELQLSGGQRQRVCLARALIKRPAILILDEPTSALDANSEVVVMDAVKKVASTGITVVMIAHRLSTTLDADHVIVMGEGKVLEQGTPRDLFAEGAVFRSLLDAQKTEFQDPEQTDDDSLALFPSRKTSIGDESSVRQSHEEYDGDDLETKLTPMSLGSVAKQVCMLAKPDGWVALCGLAASVVSGGILLGQAIIFGSLIELLNSGRQNPSYYARADFFCLMFFILALIALASYGTTGTAFGITSVRLTGRVQVKMLHRLLHLDMEWFARPGHSPHRLMKSFTKDPADLSALGGVALGAIFTIATSITGGIILALCVAWKIALVLLAAVPVMLLAGYARLRLLTASEVKHREAYSDATSLATEACRSRRSVTALCLEGHLLDQYRHALHEPHRKIRNFVFYADSLLALSFSITYFVYALAYWWGSRQVRNGSYSVTDFFIVLPALLFSAQSAGQFFSLSPEIVRAKTAARSIFTLLNAQSRILLQEGSPEAKRSASPSSDTSGVELSRPDEKPRPKLEFRNVSLSYPTAAGPCLVDVNFAVEEGQTVAFVGPSGAGKSSTIALIERFYDPTSGAVLLDGTDIRDMDVRNYRSSISLVSQDPDLFPGSLAYNVKLGAAPGQTVTDKQVEEVCRKCGLHDFVASLPDGYGTQCGSNSSSQLSGGQKQRLAIARALVRNPSILLLDEPTSALDAHSEVHVQAALAEAAKGRTTVMVAHRLASIQQADKIFVFEHGMVIAQGTHAQLMEQRGLYASMAKAQSLV